MPEQLCPIGSAVRRRFFTLSEKQQGWRRISASPGRAPVKSWAFDLAENLSRHFQMLMVHKTIFSRLLAIAAKSKIAPIFGQYWLGWDRTHGGTRGIIRTLWFSFVTFVLQRKRMRQICITYWPSLVRLTVLSTALLFNYFPLTCRIDTQEHSMWWSLIDDWMKHRKQSERNCIQLNEGLQKMHRWLFRRNKRIFGTTVKNHRPNQTPHSSLQTSD